MYKMFVTLLVISGCALSPQERWYNATGLTPIATISNQDIVICYGKITEACQKNGVITLSSQADDGTLLHELGHTFTLYHLTTGETGVMVNKRSNMSWRPCITKDDLYLVCSAVNCKWEKPEC